jgi:hypothetical protein
MLVTADNAIQILQEKYGGRYLVKEEVVVGKPAKKGNKRDNDDGNEFLY